MVITYHPLYIQASIYNTSHHHTSLIWVFIDVSQRLWLYCISLRNGYRLYDQHSFDLSLRHHVQTLDPTQPSVGTARFFFYQDGMCSKRLITSHTDILNVCQDIPSSR